MVSPATRLLTWFLCLATLPWFEELPAAVSQHLALAREAEACELWLTAAAHYSAAARRYPAGGDVWRGEAERCQRLDRIARRWRSPGFLQHLDALDLTAAMDVTRQVATTLQRCHRELQTPVSLWAKGLAHLRMMLLHPVARERLGITAPPEAIVEFVRIWERRPPANARELPRQTQTLALACQQLLGVPPEAVALEMAIGWCEGGDEYGSYLWPDLLNLERRASDRGIAGPGVTLQFLGDALAIATVAPDGPGERAGLVANALVTAIDGVATQAMGLDEAEWRLLGADGTHVELKVRGLMETADRTVRLTRRRAEWRSVGEAQMLDPNFGIGHIQVSWFQERTPHEFQEELDSLRTHGVRALILDLRGNPGGEFPAAMALADFFVPAGRLGTIKGRQPATQQTYDATNGQKVDLPIVVLMDGQTASSAEAFVAALSVHRRAVLVGTATYGKGCAQQLYSLGSTGAGMRLTVSHWYDPLDRSHHGRGLTPDVAVTGPPTDGDDARDPAFASESGTAAWQLEVALRTARRLVTGRGR